MKQMMFGMCLFVCVCAGAAVETNVWLNAEGGSWEDAANWSAGFAPSNGVPYQFVDFRALGDGARVTQTDGVKVAGAWFAAATPSVWTLPDAVTWSSGAASLDLRVDGGELRLAGRPTGGQWYKRGDGSLRVDSIFGGKISDNTWLHLEDGTITFNHSDAMSRATLVEETYGSFSIDPSQSFTRIGRLISTNACDTPMDLGGKTLGVGGVYDSLLRTVYTNGTIQSRCGSVLGLGTVPASGTTLWMRDADMEISTLTPALRDCVGFWRFNIAGRPEHDSGLRANELQKGGRYDAVNKSEVADGTPTIVADPVRGNVLSLDGGCCLKGRRNGAVLWGLPIQNQPYTVAFWAKPALRDYGRGWAAFCWGKIEENKCVFMRLEPGSDGIYFSHGGNRILNFGQGRNLFDGGWHHIAVVHSGDAKIAAYVDGAPAGTADWISMGTPAITADTGFYIGRNWSDSAKSYQGRLDDFLVMARAMDADEIAALARGETDADGVVPHDLPVQSDGNGTLRIGGRQRLAGVGGTSVRGGVTLQGGGTLTVDGDVGVAGGVHGEGSFVKEGAATLALQDACSYTGATTVAAGTLKVRGAGSLVGRWDFEDAADLGRSTERLNALDIATHGAAAGEEDATRGKVVRLTQSGDSWMGGPYTAASGFPAGNSAFTCAGWFKRSAACPNNGSFFWWGVGNVGGKSFQFRFINSFQTVAYSFFDLSYTDIRLPQAMAANAWHHLAATYDGDAVFKVFYDGVCIWSKTNLNTRLQIPASGTVMVGSYDAANGNHLARTFDGWVDDARVYNRELGVDEIAALYAGGEPAVRAEQSGLPKPVAHWSFDDPENPGKDSGPNGYDLVPTGRVNIVSSPVRGDMLKLETLELGYLKTADGSFPAKIPSGNHSFTITCWARCGQGVQASRPVVAWGEAVTEGSHSTIIDTSGDENDRRNWRFVSLFSDNAARVAYTTEESVGKGGDDLRLHHLACVYDTVAKTWTFYVDGMYSAEYHNLNGTCATPAANFYIGHKPSDPEQWFRGGEVDELRIWNQPLTVEQIRSSMRQDLVAGNGGVLPTGTDVSVGAGATFEVRGAEQSVRSLAGDGDASVLDGGRLVLTAVGKQELAGTLTLSDFDALDVPEGGELKVGTLVVGGARQPGGVYTCGAGTLRVHQGGTVLMIR